LRKQAGRGKDRQTKTEWQAGTASMQKGGQVKQIRTVKKTVYSNKKQHRFVCGVLALAESPQLSESETRHSTRDRTIVEGPRPE
jgi:hypothetical protein